MAGIKLVAKVEPDKVLQCAWRTAQDLGFKLTPIQDYAFWASKGHAVLSILAGAVAPHCQFKISAKQYEDGTTDLTLERNSAWTSGVLGSRKIKAEADALMQKLAEVLDKNGDTVVERKEI